MFKKGQTVYTIANHAVSEWKFVGYAGLSEPSLLSYNQRMICLESPTAPNHKMYEKPHRVFASYSAALLARIAQLQKTVKSLLTSAENHKATIRKLQREVRKLK